MPKHVGPCLLQVVTYVQYLCNNGTQCMIHEYGEISHEWTPVLFINSCMPYHGRRRCHQGLLDAL